jgi:hypothetical protein
LTHSITKISPRFQFIVWSYKPSAVPCRGKPDADAEDGTEATRSVLQSSLTPTQLLPPGTAYSSGKHSDPAPSKPLFTFLSLNVTPELLAIVLVYFVQGILGLSRLAVSFYFKDDLGMDPAELAIFTGFSTIPWLIKPIYGFASDTFPIFGYRRRSYLILCGLLGSAAWGAMFVFHPQAPLAALFLIIGSAGTACSDVVVDSIVVEASRGQPSSVAGEYPPRATQNLYQPFSTHVI